MLLLLLVCYFQFFNLISTKISNLFLVLPTTSIYCGESCLNQSWHDLTNLIGLWEFENSYDDDASLYHGFASPNLPIFTTGFIGQAVLFNASRKQAIFTPFIPLHEVSFTFQAWIKPIDYANPTDESIVGLCPAQIEDYCLHINLRRRKLYFGFYYNDVSGTTVIQLNQWIHAAFVFEITTKMLFIYLNGILDGSSSVTSPLMVTSGNFTIGTNEGVALPSNFFEVGRFDCFHYCYRPLLLLNDSGLY